jgi:hypothetical protein
MLSERKNMIWSDGLTERGPRRANSWHRQVYINLNSLKTQLSFSFTSLSPPQSVQWSPTFQFPSQILKDIFYSVEFPFQNPHSTRDIMPSPGIMSSLSWTAVAPLTVLTSDSASLGRRQAEAAASFSHQNMHLSHTSPPGAVWRSLAKGNARLQDDQS